MIYDIEEVLADIYAFAAKYGSPARAEIIRETLVAYHRKRADALKKGRLGQEKLDEVTIQ